MKWDGITLADVVKKELYGFLGKRGDKDIITKASKMSNAEYADFLRMKFRNSGGTGYSEKHKTYIDARNMGIEISFREPVPVELDGENAITLSWSMAARHIRAWEFDKRVSELQRNEKLRHGKIEEDTMARKLQLDAAITKDMKSAAFDSFIDNIKMIDVTEILPSEKNFYEMSAIELLADDIEREGLKHNLVVAKDPSTGCYEVKSGHRRLAAIELLIKEKRIKSTKIPCIVDGEKTEAENEFDLIMLNATQRKYTDAETMSEYEHLFETLKALKDEGKGLSGRIRDNIATLLGVSNGQVGKLDNIKNNAAEEVKEAVKSGEMSISTANEVAKLAPEKQKEIVEKKPDISSADVKKMQDKKPSSPPSPKPATSPITYFNPDAEPDDLDDNDELDDEDSDDFEGENVEVTPEKKSGLILSLILSENEAKTLLRFFYGFGDDFGAVSASDADELREIKAKLKTLCGK